MSLFDADPRPGAPLRWASKLKLVVAYDGTDFHGFAAQPDVRTVGRRAGPALEKVLRHAPDLTCAGRTDAGVHAWGQVVSLPCDPGVDPGRLQKALNGMLGPEVVVRAVRLVAPATSTPATRPGGGRTATPSSTGRSPIRSWPGTPGGCRASSGGEAMQLGADPFVGEHDFAAFCRGGPPGSTTVRRVEECRWIEAGDGVLWFEIRATAFCWQMVRSIVGTLVDIGTGARRAGDVMGMLRARDRAARGEGGPTAGPLPA